MRYMYAFHAENNAVFLRLCDQVCFFFFDLHANNYNNK